MRRNPKSDWNYPVLPYSKVYLIHNDHQISSCKQIIIVVKRLDSSHMKSVEINNVLGL